MATLPDVPKGKELEDFVAALLQCTRHFVEKNIREPDVLELDIVATRYAEGPHQPLLVEVKGDKDWGFSELFKFHGQKDYVGVRRGAFITTRLPQDRDVEFYRSRCRELAIDLIVIDDIEAANEVLEEAGYGTADEMLHEIWRYSFWAERCLIQSLRRESKSRPQGQAAREALRYYDLINNGVFLTRNVTERVEKLYEAYGSHPKLTLGAAREMSGDAFDAVTTGTSPLIKEALQEGKHELLQACMYLEHRARLSLLKATVDYLCEDMGPDDASVSSSSIKVDFGLISLPTNFVNGLSVIREQPQYRLYPVFWQVLLWGWGGFILNDRRDDEFEALSEQTGLPVSCIPDALQVFDHLFPVEAGWWTSLPTASLQLVKMVPSPFRGIGAFQRRLTAGVEKYGDLGLSGQYTASDLARWHNAGAKLLDDWGNLT